MTKSEQRKEETARAILSLNRTTGSPTESAIGEYGQPDRYCVGHYSACGRNGVFRLLRRTSTNGDGRIVVFTFHGDRQGFNDAIKAYERGYIDGLFS